MKKINKILSLVPLLILLPSCGNSCDHVYGEWMPSEDGTGHERYCTICGNKEVGQHSYSAGTVLEEANCKQEGVEAYSCEICSYIKEVSIPKTLNHTYGPNIYENEFNHKHTCQCCGITSLQGHSYDVKDPNIKYLKSEATCSSAAVYYYSCDCGASSKDTVFEDTFTYGNVLSHTVSNVTITHSPEQLSYASYEAFNPAGLEITYSCSICGQENIKANMDEVTFSYQKGNNSFRVGESEVYAYVEGTKVTIGGISVSKAVNEIYNLNDIEAHCGEDIDLSHVTSKLGTLSLAVYDKDNQLVSSKNKHYSLYEASSPYTIKASATGGDEYTPVTEITKTITITHGYEIDPDSNISICKCGQLPVEGYFYNLATNSVYCNNLRGEKADIVNHGVIVDAKTGAEPDYSRLSGKDYLILKATYNDESIQFKSVVINQLITTEEEFNTVLWAGSEKDVDGYYVLGNDIESITTHEFRDGANTSDDLKTFKATLDGDNHHIKSLVINSQYGGLFGVRNLKGSEIKNLYFDSVSKNAAKNKSNGGLFGYVGDHINLNNVHITLDIYNTCVLAGTVTYSDNLLQNCSINFGSYTLVSIYTNKGSGTNDIVTFKNTTIYYTEGAKQRIYLDTEPSYKESGINWIAL